MFTETELLVLKVALGNYRAVMEALWLPDRVEACRTALEKLEGLDQYHITLHCYGCEEDLGPECFEGHYVCRGCGVRLCGACYEDNGPTCGNPKCLDWEKWERADYEYDRRKDR